jgi:hypothetical protein
MSHHNNSNTHICLQLIPYDGYWGIWAAAMAEGKGLGTDERANEGPFEVGVGKLVL